MAICSHQNQELTSGGGSFLNGSPASVSCIVSVAPPSPFVQHLFPPQVACWVIQADFLTLSDSRFASGGPIEILARTGSRGVPSNTLVPYHRLSQEPGPFRHSDHRHHRTRNTSFHTEPLGVLSLTLVNLTVSCGRFSASRSGPVTNNYFRGCALHKLIWSNLGDNQPRPSDRLNPVFKGPD
jgi:hypothetical protein